MHCQYNLENEIVKIVNIIHLKGDKIGLKSGPKSIAKSTGKVDKRYKDNKSTPGNNSKLKPPKR